MGVELYRYAKDKYDQIGLMVLVDDVYNVESNEERRNFNINELPESYRDILAEQRIDKKEILVYSQEKIKEKGRKLLKRKGASRSSVPKCQLIVATMLKEKERLGYKNTIVLSDELKTSSGRNMIGGLYSQDCCMM